MRRLKRIAALLLVIILVGLVFLTLYCAVTGSRYFMASLMTALAAGFTICLYVYLPAAEEKRGRK